MPKLALLQLKHPFLIYFCKYLSDLLELRALMHDLETFMQYLQASLLDCLTQVCVQDQLAWTIASPSQREQARSNWHWSLCQRQGAQLGTSANPKP